MGYDSEGKQSVFNAGVAMAERIDFLQRAINAARFNPLAMNPETQTFNYQIMIDANDALLNEAWSKLTEKEKTQARRIRKLVKEFVMIKPIVSRSNKGEMRVNNENYLRFMELIDIYEKINKELLDAHSLNSPDSDDDDGL